jgi:hypothetical protein
MTTGIEARISKHYHNVHSRVFKRPPMAQNHLKRVLAEVEERKRIEAEKVAERERKIEQDQILKDMLTDPVTGVRARFANATEEARRIDIALASRDPVQRMAGFRSSPHDAYDFTDAVSVILEHHGVTWEVACSGSRLFDACAARVMIIRLFYSFGLKPVEVAAEMGIDGSTARYHWRAMNAESEKRDEPVFSRAVACVKRK